MNNPNEFYKATVNKQPSGLIRKFFNFKYNEKMIGNIAIDLGCGAFEKIKNMTNKITCIFSDNDYFVSLDQEKEFKELLNAKTIIVNGKGHISADDEVFELDDIFFLIKEMLK